MGIPHPPYVWCICHLKYLIIMLHKHFATVFNIKVLVKGYILIYTDWYFYIFLWRNPNKHLCMVDSFASVFICVRNLIVVCCDTSVVKYFECLFFMCVLQKSSLSSCHVLRYSMSCLETCKWGLLSLNGHWKMFSRFFVNSSAINSSVVNMFLWVYLTCFTAVLVICI